MGAICKDKAHRPVSNWPFMVNLGVLLPVECVFVCVHM